jgi:hypothetical protein
MTVDVDRALSLQQAIDKMLWGASGVVAHPTAYCTIYRGGDCSCGLWDAIKEVAESRFGRMIFEYYDSGKLPT